jgi:hypothetical protein
MNEPILKVGDEVYSRWGQTTVKRIEECADGEKYGREVKSMPWLLVPLYAVVDLNNGHWAYGYQITRMSEAGSSGEARESSTDG